MGKLDSPFSKRLLKSRTHGFPDVHIQRFIAQVQIGLSDGGPTTRVVLRQHAPSDPWFLLRERF
jgi:hypothetical protein